MIGQTVWGDLQRQALTSADDCRPGFAITLLQGRIDKEAVWTVKPAQHHVLVHLSDASPIRQARFDNGLSTMRPAAAGDLCVIPAGSQFTAHINVGQARFCDIVVPVDGPDCDRISLAARFAPRDDFLQEAVNSLDRKRKEAKLPASAHHLAAAVFWHIIDRYQWEDEPADIFPPSLPLRAKEALVDFISENLTESIRPEELAEICGQTVHTFLRLFYASFGTTPAQYIARARIERAKSLLSLSRAAVDDIAFRCGFSDPAYFSSSFIKHVGIAPLSYRQARQ